MSFQIDIASRIEAMKTLDRSVRKVRDVAGKVLPAEGPVKDLLSGTLLGHPLHPVLTDVVLGAWFSAALLDTVGGERSRQAATRLVGIGIAAAIPTAVAGASDWVDTLDPRARRVGLVHAASNATGLSLWTLSYLARKRRRYGAGLVLGMLAGACSALAGLLGGHLTFRRGVGVDETAFDRVPRRWTVVLPERDLPERKLVGATANGVGILLYREGVRIFALADRCSHRGCDIHDGEVHDGAVTCPCHGSTFRLEDGSIVRGPATAPQPSYETRVEQGSIEVRPKA